MGRIFRLGLAMAMTLTSIQTIAEEPTVVVDQQVVVDFDDNLPAVFKALNKLPPEAAISVLKLAREDVNMFIGMIDQFDQDLKEARRTPLITPEREKIYNLTTPVAIAAGIGTVVTVVLDLMFSLNPREGDRPESYRNRRFKVFNPHLKSPIFYWFAISSAVFAYTQWFDQSYEIDVQLDREEIAHLERQIRDAKEMIGKREAIIEKMFEYQNLRSETVVTTRTTETTETTTRGRY